uniref:Phospholipase D n=1 Tax=Macrostomum lignano TaxID=282301 RepID=A0A1I8I7M6_9PLAT
MFEAPVWLLNASDCLENDACFGAFAAARRRCQSLIGGPCTGRLGRFCLDRRCSRSEQRDSVERWMFVGDTYIGLLNMESNEIEEVMLFDAEFHVLTGKDSKQLGTCGMKLINNFCQLHVAFQREVDSRVLARAISLAMSGDPSWNWDDAPMASIVSTEAGGSSVLGEAPPTASNGFLFSRRLSLIRSTQNSLLSSASVGGGAGVRISKNDPVSDSAAMEEQALAAAFAVAAASTATGRNANNATVDHRSTELTAMMMAATGETTDGSENSFYAGQRHQQQLLRQQRRKRRKKQREARQSGASIIGRGQERSERQRQNELEQQQLQSDLDLEVPVHSFAPPRSATKAQWYVDAGSYFYAVADAIDMAQAEIFVCGSVLAPEVYLKRPDPDGRYQLGRLLIEKAKLRVQVFILLDNPNCLKDTNACLHVLDYFEGVPNVHIMLSPFDLDDASNEFFKPALGLMKAFLVMRRRLYNRCFGRFFPGIGATASGGSGSSKMGCRVEDLYYKHNEKCVVIDQKVALISGVDLTWGSWDTSQHVINDVPTNSTTAMNELGPQQYRGQEACVRTFWMNPATMCTVMTPPIMSCLDEDVTEDDRANAKPVRSEAAMMYLPESLRDLVVPKEKLGTDSDYDNFAHTQRAYMTKPYSVFTDANDPTLNPQYFEAVHLLDSRYRNAVRVAWTFQRKSVRMPDLRLFEAPGCLPDKIEEPAYASEIFPPSEDPLKRLAGASGDRNAEFLLFKERQGLLDKPGYETQKQQR